MTPDERARRYVQTAIGDELDRAAKAAPGTMNDRLFEAACALGSMVASGWLSHQEAEIGLRQAAERHIRNDGEAKAIRTIRSGLNRGKTVRRELPPDLRDAAVDGRPVARVSAEAMRQMREQARESERQAEWHREEARKHLAEADYCDRAAKALWQQAEALADLRRRGIDDFAVESFSLGFDMWPVKVKARQYKRPGTVPSLVIPWMRRDKLMTVQYRHLAGSNAKYHWHDDMGAGKLFHGDALLDPHDDYVLVVEGALNAATLWSRGLTSVVGLPSLSGWKASYAPFFESFQDVYFVPDAGAASLWARCARDVPGSKVATLPADPDEYLMSVGGNVDALWRALQYAEEVP